MSGLLRNLLVFVAGLFALGSRGVRDTVITTFRVTPFDSGTRVLKSDKYLQFVETAQVDYLLRVGAFFPVLRSGAGFVNAAAQVRFLRSVPLFGRVRVETRLLHADDRCAYFSHVFLIPDGPAAEVLIKMKFKRGRQTLPPATFLPAEFQVMPAQLQRWDAALDVA